MELNLLAIPLRKRDALFCIASGSSSTSIRLPAAKPRVVALLPRSRYLIKVLEVPAVTPAEIEQLLSLEVSASLPPEFGHFQLSWRSLASTRPGHHRYEVAIARETDLQAYLESLGSVATSVDDLIPTSVAWAQLVSQSDSPRLRVARVGPDELELATIDPRGLLIVRTATDATLPSSIAEISRSILRQSPDTLPIERLDTDSASPDPSALLKRMAAALIPHLRTSLLAQANILPRRIILDRTSRQIRRTISQTLAIASLALLIACAALLVTVARYRSSTRDTAAAIAAIRRDGESVGLRIQQLSAIQTATATRDDLTRIIAALIDAGPSDIGYSAIELTPDGALQLQGHAPSLAVPVALPERLERGGTFHNARLRDAAQHKRADASISEFRIDARLHRGRTR